MRLQPVRRKPFIAIIVATAAIVNFSYAASTADKQTVPASVIEQLSRDLTDLQRTVREGQTSPNKNPSLATFETAPATTIVKVTEAGAPIREGAAVKAASLTTAKAGQQFQVVDRAGDWYAISLPNGVNGINTGWVNAASVVPVGFSGFVQRTADAALQKGIEKAVELKDAYANNPYISVSGFSISAGTDTSISMSFEFK